MVLALTGSSDLIDLLKGAQQLKNRLLSLPNVSKVHLVADPGEQITIALDAAVSRRLGISPQQAAAQARIAETELSDDIMLSLNEATAELKQVLGPNPDMWQGDSRIRFES